ncbi:DUF3426 domain-containing protein [Pacificispira sp.]|uniref:DUF3426 domain-containing protein n=1 Tax=Pacificispira sp. TaxID=2888761 RepID=UPI003B51E5C6
MILSCPNCETRFRVKDDAIGPNGRKVKCRNCAHTWKAMPDGSVGESAPPPPPPPRRPAAPPVEDDPVPPPPPPAAPRREEPAPPPTDLDMGAPPEAAAPPPIPPGEEFVLRQRKPKVEKKSPVMAWVILVILILATAGVGWFFQRDLVGAFPPIAKVYDWVGIDVNLLGHGLTIPNPDEVTIELRDDGQTLIISGKVLSETDEQLDIPMLQGKLIDTNGQTIHAWTFTASKPNILPGEAVPYTTEVLNPPAGAVKADISFVAPGEGAMMQGGESGAGQSN